MLHRRAHAKRHTLHIRNDLHGDGTHADRLACFAHFCVVTDFTEEHDEILLAFANNLKLCLEPAGGPENATQIFMILHKLCGTEETVVREGVRAKSSMIGSLGVSLLALSTLRMCDAVRLSPL